MRRPALVRSCARPQRRQDAEDIFGRPIPISIAERSLSGEPIIRQKRPPRNRSTLSLSLFTC